MFTWLVIIFVLALVFGVVKIETLKDWGNKALNIAKDNVNKLQNTAANSQENEKKDADNQK